MKNKNWALVLIGHGSRLEPANEEIRRVALQLQARLERPVFPAFLELANPTIMEAIDLALEKSPREILVLPYFLTQGRHVQTDIPELLSVKAKVCPETPIKLLPYLGSETQLVELLADLILKGVAHGRQG